MEKLLFLSILMIIAGISMITITIVKFFRRKSQSKLLEQRFKADALAPEEFKQSLKEVSQMEFQDAFNVRCIWHKQWSKYAVISNDSTNLEIHWDVDSLNVGDKLLVKYDTKVIAWTKLFNS